MNPERQELARRLLEGVARDAEGAPAFVRGPAMRVYALLALLVDQTFYAEEHEDGEATRAP